MQINLGYDYPKQCQFDIGSFLCDGLEMPVDCDNATKVVDLIWGHIVLSSVMCISINILHGKCKLCRVGEVV